MIIELVGPPGAGKSTLVPGLASHLAHRGAEVTKLREGHASRWRKHGARAWAVACNPGLAQRAVPLARRAPAQGIGRLVVLDQRLRGLARRPGWWLVDGGCWHRLLWATAFQDRSADARALGDRLTAPDVFLYVAVDPDVALTRAFGQDRRKVSKKVGPGAARDGVVRYHELAQELLPRTGARVVEFTGDLARAAAEIEQAVGSDV